MSAVIKSINGDVERKKEHTKVFLQPKLPPLLTLYTVWLVLKRMHNKPHGVDMGEVCAQVDIGQE